MRKSYHTRMIEAAEELEWKVTQCDDGSYEFEKYTPAGEDFIFYTDGDSLSYEVRDYADGFDTEEHIAMHVLAKQNGVSGIPSIRELCDDAEEIQKMLDELADALEAVEEDDEGGD